MVIRISEDFRVADAHAILRIVAAVYGWIRNGQDEKLGFNHALKFDYK
jgi:hypothetical protein